MDLAIGLLIPFVGTTLGAAMVFLMKNTLNAKLEKFLGGFASGVMISASMWSLLLPAKEMSIQQGVPAWIPTAVGFVCGIAFLFLFDVIIPHIHVKGKTAEGVKSKCTKTTMMLLAVTMHNIPEGMAVGVILAGALNGNAGVSLAAAMALSFGIAVQNFPEGAIISMPLRAQGMSRGKSFLWGVLSGVVEPIAGVITVLLTSFMSSILPYLLSFAAGAMIYVVVEELIPDSQNGPHSNLGTLGVSAGFLLMMILDIALG